jgi:hypothetical protein
VKTTKPPPEIPLWNLSSIGSTKPPNRRSGSVDVRISIVFAVSYGYITAVCATLIGSSPALGNGQNDETLIRFGKNLARIWIGHLTDLEARPLMKWPKTAVSKSNLFHGYLG